ncbi:MAG: PEP/pyruvate-binding domain-containing protein [Janthinobacterium lividum]
MPGRRPALPPAQAAARLGGKAAGLLRLRALGLPVPEFVVLPAALFEPRLVGLPTTAAGLAERRARLSRYEVPPATQAALRPVLAAWGFPGAAVAVRSSVADEDGTTAAFPGMMDSVLNVSDWPALWAAVARVAASAYSDRALAYRRQRGLVLAARPAVVVQRQVAARAAGVLFTTFPEYPQEMAVHAVAGLGEGLVGGQLVPEEYYLNKANGQLVSNVAQSGTPLLIGQEGVACTSASPAPTKAECHSVLLSPGALAELYRFAQHLETALGHPQDVEFAQDETGKIWLVQTRPLTQPVPEVVVYDNANIQESYCGVTTPLTFSFAQRAYATVYRQTMRTLGLPAATVAAHEPVIINLLALRQGRIYYNLNNWYRGLQLLPNFSQSKADMERMMGVLEPVDFVRDQRKTLAQKLALLPRLAFNLSRLLAEFARLPGQVQKFQRRFEAEYHRFYQLPLATLSAPELLREIEHLDQALLTRWTTPIINDFRVMMANGTATRRLAQLGIADPEEFLSRYLAGSPEAAEGSPAAEPLASLLPALALRELGHLARCEYPALLPLLHQPGPALPAQVARLAPAFHQRVQHYVARYGDRTMGELKLETETMRTDETLFYQYLTAYLTPAAPATAPTSLPAQAAAELAALLRPRGWWRARQVRGSLAALRQAVACREALRLARTRLFGMYRATYRHLGQRLAAAGTLAAPLDIFFLTETEIREAARAGGPPWVTLVAARQVEFAAYRAAPAPAGRQVVPARPAAPTEAALPADGRLCGTGCYPGQVQGEVVVITDPAQAAVGVVRGRIVAALRTDPGWAALFPGCRAVLIERGSALSHSVIVLRELGIPTIINVPGLTQHLRSGQHVQVDGRTGEIVLLG